MAKRVKKATKLGPKPGKGKSTACRHHWAFEHIVYSVDGTNDKVAVHRQCRECNKHEMGIAEFGKMLRGYDVPSLDEQGDWKL